MGTIPAIAVGTDVTQLNPPMHPASRASGSKSAPWRRRACLASGIVLLSGFVGVSSTRAQSQDVAEAARQEKARREKDKEARRPRHVYTEKDLARSKILTPEDRERLEARRKTSEPLNAAKSPSTPGATPQDPAARGNDQQKPQVSLGEVARHHRQQEQARQEQESAARKFPMKLDGAPFAAPAHPVRPGPMARPLRRSPFEKPALRAPLVKPSLRASEPPRGAQPAYPVQPARPMTQPVTKALQSVTLQRGDSLWKIAQKNLGKGSRWQELLAMNPWIGDPNRIAAGSQILVPAASSAVRPPLKIQVQPGDTLWKIARAHFGRGTAWNCILSANPQVADADRIFPGQQLIVPAGCIP